MADPLIRVTYRDGQLTTETDREIHTENATPEQAESLAATHGLRRNADGPDGARHWRD